MVELDRQNDSSNQKKQPPPSSNDPLRQLNQFETRSPKQPGNQKQQNQPQTQHHFDWNALQQQLKAWFHQLRNLWEQWSQSPFVERLKENPRLIWIGGGSLVVCLLVIVGIVFASGDDDESKDVIEEFHQAVLDGDKEKLKEMLESDDPDLEIDDAYITKLIDSINKDDKFLLFLLNIMRIQKSLYEGKDQEAVIYFEESLNDIGVPKKIKKEAKEKVKLGELRKLKEQFNIYLKENDGLFSFLGPDYVIGVRPVYIKLSLANKPTKVILDQKPIQLKKGAKEQVIGPLLPRFYVLKATKKYPFAEVTDKEEIFPLINDDNNIHKLEFYFIGTNATFKSEIEGTELFINNQSTKKKVNREGVDFGPVSLDGKLKAHGQFTFPFGTLKSDPQTISEETVDITPNPFSNEKVKQEVIKRINDYAKEVVEAQKKKDGTLFTSLDDNLKSKWVNDMAEEREYSTSYRGEAIKTVIAVKDVTITKSEEGDTYKIKVPVKYHWRERKYGAFDTGNEPLEEKVEESYTWLIYNHKQKRWEISELNPIYFSEDLFNDSSAITTDFKS